MNVVDLPRPAAILDIVEQHFEELDFLWEQREGIIFAADWTLGDLAEHEERCEAHLDGLRIAQGHAVDLARPALAADERGAATAATLVMMAFERAEFEAEVLQAFETGAPPARDGVRIGLRHSDVSRVADRLEHLASAGDIGLRLAALDVLAFHRLPAPANLSETARPAGPGQWARPGGPGQWARLFPSLARFGGPWSTNELFRVLEGGDDEAQRAALELSARLGLKDLAGTCRQFAKQSETALAFLGVVGEAADLGLLTSALDDAEAAASAIAGLGALGQVRAIPRLIDAMADETVSHHAGAAFVRIVGTDPDIEADELPPPPEGLTEDEQDLWNPPLPADPEKARSWWDKEGGQFTEAGRWQHGHDLGSAASTEQYDALPLAARRDAYLRNWCFDRTSSRDLELEELAKRQTQRVQLLEG